MNLLVRIVLFSLLMCLIWGGEQYYLQTVQAPETGNVSVRQLNGGDPEFQELQHSEFKKNSVTLYCWLGSVVIGLVFFGTYLYKLGSKPTINYVKGSSLMILVCVTCLALNGCEKPYDVPEYADVDTAETAFLIHIEGNTGDQAKFESEQFLESAKVAAKRVQITHRWNQTGRSEEDGSWIPDVRLIKINRSPVTRLWTKDPNTGTSAKNEAVSIESKDSINFSMGFTCTAMITEVDAAKFLYFYPAGSLANVMDTEVLGRIQKVCQNVASNYECAEVRFHKAEIQKAVETELTTFYASRGITVTNVGLYGGLTYDNPQIQKGMDDAAMSANLKVVAQAKYDAQQKTNDQIILEATGKAQAAQAAATGEAQAILIKKKAEADGIRAINSALSEAKDSQILLALKQLEVQQAMNEKWNGAYPTWYFGGGAGGGGSPALMLNVPSPSSPVTK